jgi:outer membrane immunogenic protein
VLLVTFTPTYAEILEMRLRIGGGLIRNKLVSSVAGTAFSFAASGVAFAADMAVKAPPPPPAPVPTWTGFYAGIQFGGGWSDEAVNYSPNDVGAAAVLSGNAVSPSQAVANGYRISQSGPVGGFEAGYNWQAGSNWLVGAEADFSWAGMDGKASGTTTIGFVTTQTTAATQETDWYGTVRGRVGWLATPNLQLFATGGFAYGRVDGSAYYATQLPFLINPGVVVNCPSTVPCFTGSSSAISTGWTAGGGAEWMLDQHWSAKIEYQFVDLGTETVRIIAAPFPGSIPPSFNAAFRDQFNVVRLGLNYRF